ncbi:hypothetical protein [Kribbella jiaozuonensis]|nr:hypothetical protein [Kribbella jiaozuonensis]
MTEAVLGAAGLVVLAYVLTSKRDEPAQRLTHLVQALAELVAAWRK